MGLLSVLVAAAAAWIFGAVWYSVMAKPWMEAADLTEETVNRKNILAYVGSFICAVLVAGMTRHVLTGAGVDSVVNGLLSGLGLGLFIATPWLTTNYLFSQRPFMLIVIDGVYATVGSMLIGGVLVLMS